MTPTNQFSPFFASNGFFQFAPRQQLLTSFQFNSALFNTQFGFPSTFQNRLFFERQLLLLQQSFAFNPFLSQGPNGFTFNPFLGTNQLGAFAPFMNTSFTPVMNTGFTPFMNTGFTTTSPFIFPSTGVSLGGF